MIVGNGEIGQGHAAAIDSADFVVRFNECGSFGTGGERTDAVAVCNTGRPGKAMLGSAVWREHPAVRAAREIWSVRDPHNFAVLRTRLVFSHPELDDFCDDHTNEFNGFCADSGRRHRVVEKSIHDRVDLALAAFSPAPYVVPSSGMIVIADVLENQPDDEVVIAGFSYRGWEWHPFAAERQLVDRYEAEGRLRRLENIAAPVNTPYISRQG
jgi:hypothetical protein